MASIEIQKITQGLIDGQISVTKADRLIEAEFQSRVNDISDEDIKKQFKITDIVKNSSDLYNDGQKEGAKWFKNKLLKQ